MTCKETEKLVMPYINYRLGEKELESFLNHIRTCDSCKEELEIYYTVAVGLKQLDNGTGAYDITGALEESLELAWLKVRTVRLRKVITYAVNTLCVTGVLMAFLLQCRIWLQAGIFR